MSSTQDPNPGAEPYTLPPQAPPVQPMPVPQIVVERDPRLRSVPLALFLSLMPGLGQVYVGYYKAGFIHILTVASTITLLSNDAAREISPLLGLFLAFFWLYNIVDAGRRAFAYNLALASTEQAEITMPEGFSFPAGGTMLAGLIVTVVGSLILLENVLGISMAWVEKWWAVIPVIFGLYLLFRGMKESMNKN